MAERSKARGSGPRLARGVGSNPTGEMRKTRPFFDVEAFFFIFKKKVLTDGTVSNTVRLIADEPCLWLACGGVAKGLLCFLLFLALLTFY